ncbi:hypothetical protein NUSPORA_02626 [Nucleospora cyclopteri]
MIKKSRSFRFCPNLISFDANSTHLFAVSPFEISISSYSNITEEIPLRGLDTLKIHNVGNTCYLLGNSEICILERNQVKKIGHLNEMYSITKYKDFLLAVTAKSFYLIQNQSIFTVKHDLEVGIIADVRIYGENIYLGTEKGVLLRVSHFNECNQKITPVLNLKKSIINFVISGTSCFVITVANNEIELHKINEYEQFSEETEKDPQKSWNKIITLSISEYPLNLSTWNRWIILCTKKCFFLLNSDLKVVFSKKSYLEICDIKIVNNEFINKLFIGYKQGTIDEYEKV